MSRTERIEAVEWAYARGEIELDELERRVAALLAGESGPARPHPPSAGPGDPRIEPWDCRKHGHMWTMGHAQCYVCREPWTPFERHPIDLEVRP